MDLPLSGMFWTDAYEQQVITPFADLSLIDYDLVLDLI